MSEGKAAPRKPALDRPVAMRLAATEYTRIHGTLAALPAEEWTLPTNCPGWDVRAMACHVLGMADMFGTPWETRRQLKEAGKRGGNFVDALTALQVEERADLEPQYIVHQLAKAGPKAAKGRQRVPSLVRRRRLPPEQTDGIEPWTLGFLVDVILTRDPWMHRMDIAEATGRAPTLTAEHDGVLVADVVAEWAERHGEACDLTLTGPAGGTWRFRTGGPALEYDAIDFCRMVSGRAGAEGLLATAVPF